MSWRVVFDLKLSRQKDEVIVRMDEMFLALNEMSRFHSRSA